MIPGLKTWECAALWEAKLLSKALIIQEIQYSNSRLKAGYKI